MTMRRLPATTPASATCRWVDPAGLADLLFVQSPARWRPSSPATSISQSPGKSSRSFKSPIHSCVGMTTDLRGPLIDVAWVGWLVLQAMAVPIRGTHPAAPATFKNVRRSKTLDDMMAFSDFPNCSDLGSNPAKLPAPDVVVNRFCVCETSRRHESSFRYSGPTETFACVLGLLGAFYRHFQQWLYSVLLWQLSEENLFFVSAYKCYYLGVAAAKSRNARSCLHTLIRLPKLHCRCVFKSADALVRHQGVAGGACSGSLQR